MIRFAEQDQLVAKIARSLTHSDNSACWQIVLPPGFIDEQSFVGELLTALQKRAPDARMACVHADAVVGRDAYARALAESWKIPLEPTAPDPLQTLLGRLSPRHPGIQILTHFHKIVRTLDMQVLGDLREAEQSPGRRLRTVTLTPLPYSELKERWRSEGAAFSVSDYGDTHQLENPAPLSLDALRKTLVTHGLPTKLVEFVLCVTGGYPAPLQAMIERWEAEDRPPPKPAFIELLRQVAEQRFDRFVAWLDRGGESRYCAYVSDLYHGIEVGNARIHLSLHPWREVLFGPESLRSQAVGMVAATRLAKLAQNALDAEPGRALWHRARELYRMSRYVEVARMLDAAPALALRAHLRLLSLHARIMAVLIGGINEGSPADADWKQLIFLLEQAQIEGGKTLDAELLLPRYTELLTTARDVVKALAAGPRPVDVLGGLRGDGAAPASAVFLIILCLKAGSHMTSPSAALKVVFELPEQIFRCWAYSALQLNFYSAPGGSKDNWHSADAAWRSGGIDRSPLERSLPGKEFRSFAAFAFFALAEHAKRGGDAPQAPEPDFAALDRSLSHFDKRKDFAHAVATANEKERRNYFSMIERWLDAFCAVCPPGCSRLELSARVDPLPLVAEDGVLIS